MHASDTHVFKPDDDVVSVHEDIPIEERERGKVIRSLEPGETEEPRYSVKWEGYEEPLEELACELLPARNR